MPVIHIRALAPGGGTERIEDALRLIAREVSAPLGEEPRSTWCTFTPVSCMSLGERIVELDDRIVYVDLWMRPHDEPTRIAVLEAACRAAAHGFNVPVEDVWGVHHEVTAGRVFAGGAIVPG
jgi:hypothetical protein